MICEYSETRKGILSSIAIQRSSKRDVVLVYSDSDEEDKEYYRLSHTPHTTSTPLDKKDSGLDEILDDLFRIRAENLKRIEQEKVQNGCDDDISRDTNHESGNHLNFPISPVTNEFASVCEQDVDNINV
ncbi:hypothetical protein Tco_1186911 [Tanacetum coccineum]